MPIRISLIKSAVHFVIGFFVINFIGKAIPENLCFIPFKSTYLLAPVLSNKSARTFIAGLLSFPSIPLASLSVVCKTRSIVNIWSVVILSTLSKSDSTFLYPSKVFLFTFFLFL